MTNIDNWMGEFDVVLKTPAYEALKKMFSESKCLHQIQEPSAAEQAAWHAGLDEGRAQAAPAAVAVPDECAAFEAKFRHLDLSQKPDAWGHARYSHDAISLAWEAWQARAALAATPAADIGNPITGTAASVLLPEPVAWLANYEDREGNSKSYTSTHKDLAQENDTNGEPQSLFTEQQVRALLAGVSAPAAQAVEPLDIVQAAADAASVGHLSHLIDHQSQILARAMAAMKAVESTASPADEADGDFDARIPYESWATFVDTRAALLHDVKQSPVAVPQAQADARDAGNVRAIVEKLPRYTYGFKGDDWGMNQSLRSYESTDGAFLRRDEVLAAIAAQAAQQGGDKQ